MPKHQKTPQIQKIAPQQHSKVAEILSALPDINGFSWSPKKILTELNEAEAWGLWDEEGLAAFVILRENSEAYEISALATAQHKQRQGVMRDLLKELIRIKNEKKWWLEVHEENKPALELYLSLGFKEDGRRPKYYPDGRAAVLMSLS